jgi:hypothetical protein
MAKPANALRLLSLMFRDSQAYIEWDVIGVNDSNRTLRDRATVAALVLLPASAGALVVPTDLLRQDPLPFVPVFGTADNRFMSPEAGERGNYLTLAPLALPQHVVAEQ